MVDAPRTGHDTPLPEGLLEVLAATPCADIRPEEVARARRHVEERCYDDGAVVREIASQLLQLSHP